MDVTVIGAVSADFYRAYADFFATSAWNSRRPNASLHASSARPGDPDILRRMSEPLSAVTRLPVPHRRRAPRRDPPKLHAIRRGSSRQPMLVGNHIGSPGLPLPGSMQEKIVPAMDQSGVGRGENGVIREVAFSVTDIYGPQKRAAAGPVEQQALSFQARERPMPRRRRTGWAPTRRPGLVTVSRTRRHRFAAIRLNATQKKSEERRRTRRHRRSTKITPPWQRPSACGLDI